MAAHRQNLDTQKIGILPSMHRVYLSDIAELLVSTVYSLRHCRVPHVLLGPPVLSRMVRKCRPG